MQQNISIELPKLFESGRASELVQFSQLEFLDAYLGEDLTCSRCLGGTMGADVNERSYKKDKFSKHKQKKRTDPFVMIGSEILNSSAYKDLSYSGRSMLVELLHFYSGTNNGQIWIAPTMLDERGFSKNTATRALKELRVHGFIYMTKRGGNLRGGCSWFALTWRPIDRSDGQHLENYRPNAYLKWAKSPENQIGINGSSGCIK
ncbi:hypothetical protein ICU98_03025 [Polynucleobacter sp. MWH-P3-07-1]|uniref:hypothetical protein n=1 Tax=Polynucleobacter sp. MWH-P3-07-1 TaxID=1743173 RepID=UPI001BFD02CD|nr:hypothetical protein [Polynucleobacter sp. MWH-P3-07-1]QWD84054.1 hypothetical protein ICU98_03025 [Polynucleobacter sp. MWH-P3-07-1]